MHAAGNPFSTLLLTCIWLCPLSQRRNPLALAHFANHPPPGRQPNVVVASYDAHLEDGKLDSKKLCRASTRVTKSGQSRLADILSTVNSADVPPHVGFDGAASDFVLQARFLLLA